MNLLKIAVVFALTVSAALAQIMPPQGRLTLNSGQPVMQSDLDSTTTIYYTPYIGNQIPIYNGTSFVNTSFSQLTMTLDNTNNTKGNIYDLFVFLHSGTPTIGTGPAWATAPTPASGSGAPYAVGGSRGGGVLTQLNGVWVNTSTTTLTNGSTSYNSVPADEATFVGSVYITTTINGAGSAGETGVYMKPTPATGGGSNVIGLYNAYNRVRATSLSRDSATSWTESSSSWVTADTSRGNAVTWLDGSPTGGEISVKGHYQVQFSSSANNAEAAIAVSFDGAAPDLAALQGIPTGAAGDNTTLAVEENFLPATGLHYMQAWELTNGVTVTFYGASFQFLSLDTDF